MSAKACCVKVKNCGGALSGILASMGSGFVSVEKALSGVFSSLLFLLEHPTTITTPEKEQMIVTWVDAAVNTAKGLEDKTIKPKEALRRLWQCHTDLMNFTEEWALEG